MGNSTQSGKDNMCVVVRTYDGHHRYAGALLQTLVASATKAGIALSVSILNTDPRMPLSQCFVDNIKIMADESSSSDTHVTIVKNSILAAPEPRYTAEWYTADNNDYGYFDTDLEFLWLRQHGSAANRGVTVFEFYDDSGRSKHPSKECDNFLITNGDNLYMSDFFQTSMDIFNSDPEVGATIFGAIWPRITLARRDVRKLHLWSVACILGQCFFVDLQSQNQT